MKVTVDRDLCQGHGQCEIVAPDMFTLDDDAYAVVLLDDGGVPADRESEAREATACCPVQAIVFTPISQ
jgi:ferredoxin